LGAMKRSEQSNHPPMRGRFRAVVLRGVDRPRDVLHHLLVAQLSHLSLLSLRSPSAISCRTRLRIVLPSLAACSLSSRCNSVSSRTFNGTSPVTFATLLRTVRFIRPPLDT